MAQAACSIQLEKQPMCCHLDPSAPLLAVGGISGLLNVYSFTYTPADTPVVTYQQQLSAQTHSRDQSCRAVWFLPGGVGQVVSGGEDQTVVVTEVASGKQVWQQLDAHDAAISLVRALAGSDNPSGGWFVTGDEDGAVKVWDIRQKKQVMSYKKHTDFISDSVLNDREQALVITSGDGTLSVHDLRTNKYKARSEVDADDELLSCAILKGGKKVVAGTGSGVLALYSWGYWNDCSDRFPGHPESVDALVVWDQSTILTGSSDGLIRAVNILPNKLLGVVGAHEELPIEHLALSHDRRLLASTSHDDTVRLWDLSILHGDDDDDEEEEESAAEEEEEELTVGAGVRQGKAVADSGDDDDDDDDDDSFDENASDSDDDDDDIGSGDLREGEGEEGEEEAGSGEGEGPAEAEAEVKQPGKAKSKDASNTAAAAGGAGSSKAAAPASDGDEEEGDRSGDDDDDDDDDSDAGGKNKRGRNKRQRERTKWTKQKNQKVKNNFFDGLL